MNIWQSSRRTGRHRFYLRTVLNRRRRVTAHFFLVVGVPLVSFDQGVNWAAGGDPLPSPPPCGWSQGFFTTPRTVGRIPRQRFAPAFGIRSCLCPLLEQRPRVAMALKGTLISQPEADFNVALPASFATSVAAAPAERKSWAPRNGTNSTLCTKEKRLIKANGMAEPLTKALFWLGTIAPE